MVAVVVPMLRDLLSIDYEPEPPHTSVKKNNKTVREKFNNKQ